MGPRKIVRRGSGTDSVTIRFDEPIVPVAVKLRTVLADGSPSLDDLVVQDIKIGGLTYTANSGMFAAGLLTGEQEFHFGVPGKVRPDSDTVTFPLYNPFRDQPYLRCEAEVTAVSAREAPDGDSTNLAVFNCDYDRTIYPSLREATEGLVRSVGQQRKDILITPGLTGVVGCMPQIGGTLREILMKPDLVEAIGTSVDVAVSAVDVVPDWSRRRQVEVEHTRRPLSGQVADGRYVLDEGHVWVGERILIEVVNHSFHRPINWYEFAAPLVYDSARSSIDMNLPRYGGFVPGDRRPPSAERPA